MNIKRMPVHYLMSKFLFFVASEWILLVGGLVAESAFMSEHGVSTTSIATASDKTVSLQAHSITLTSAISSASPPWSSPITPAGATSQAIATLLVSTETLVETSTRFSSIVVTISAVTLVSKSTFTSDLQSNSMSATLTASGRVNSNTPLVVSASTLGLSAISSIIQQSTWPPHIYSTGMVSSSTAPPQSIQTSVPSQSQLVSTGRSADAISSHSVQLTVSRVASDSISASDSPLSTNTSNAISQKPTNEASSSSKETPAPLETYIQVAPLTYDAPTRVQASSAGKVNELDPQTNGFQHSSSGRFMMK